MAACSWQASGTRTCRCALLLVAASIILTVSMNFVTYTHTHYPIRTFASTKTPDGPGKRRDTRDSKTQSTNVTRRGVIHTHFRAMPRPLDDANQGQSSRNVAQTDDLGERALTEKEVAERFEKRRRLLRAACERYSNPSEFRRIKVRSLPSLRYPPVMNVTVGYCPIPKTSTTTWRRIFSSIRREMERRHVEGKKVEVSLKERDVLFTFVREPYGRLLSAYVDKLFSPDRAFWVNIGRFAVKNFRGNATHHSLQCGHDVTFPEFIKFFIHSNTIGEVIDYHTIPIHSHCEMCKYQYNYIGHLETIEEDMPFILKAIQSPASVYGDTVYDYVTIEENSKIPLSEKRLKIAECIGLDEASRRLWKKWQIRGVIHRSQQFPLTDEDTVNITAEALQKVAIDALGRSGPRSERVGQKKEAMREAFASVPLEDRLEVQRLLFLDFQMFGFDPQPDEVFPTEPFKPDPKFSYLDLYRP